MNSKTRINYEIKTKEVRLIGADGEQLGIVPTIVAIKKAEEAGFDLVEVSPNAKPPVCKLMDYGKFQYEQSKKIHSMKQHQRTGQVKELKFRPHINDHDLGIKIHYVERFLEEGNKAKVALVFRGREMIRSEIGTELMQKMITALGPKAIVESPPKFEGTSMTMVLAPSAPPKTPSRDLKEGEGERSPQKD
ncbi:MAG: translation initiation factor IF-3 [Nitrospirae bacterium]|nr:translation initiation factor IF-3 [Nitrospirota bacterium]